MTDTGSKDSLDVLLIFGIIMLNVGLVIIVNDDPIGYLVVVIALACLGYYGYDKLIKSPQNES